MITEQELNDRLGKIEDETLNEACRLISSYNGSVMRVLAEITASLCDVQTPEMMYETKNIDAVHARWLYWMAYKYMTKESYETMSNGHTYGRHFSPATISQAVIKMSMMANEDEIWIRRWVTVKRFVKLILRRNEAEQDSLFNPTIVVKYPKGVKVELRQE